jgi:hypothetical protein
VEVAAGSDGVVLTLAGAEPTHAVAGRVTNLAGAPLAGASVHVQRRRRTNEGLRTHRVDRSFQALTDAEGRFRFEALCTAGTDLLVSSAGSPHEAACALDGEIDLERIVVRMPAVCHLRVLLADPARADALMLEDERGEDLFLTIQSGGVLLSASAVTISGGVSDLIQTDETARTLVLAKDGVKERIPIRLRPGEVTEIRP